MQSKVLNGFIIYSNGDIYSQDKYVAAKGGSLRKTKAKKLTQFKDKNGYLLVTCRGLGIKSNDQYRVHRLVALAFLGDSDLEVNHKNGVKDDNRVENLEYVTSKQNSVHAVEMGLVKVGAGHHLTKPVQICKNGFGYVCFGLAQISKTGLRFQSVHRAARKQRKSINGWICDYV